jgi:pimeloyl-ACP methyl ester carboxylesterase
MAKAEPDRRNKRDTMRISEREQTEQPTIVASQATLRRRITGNRLLVACGALALVAVLGYFAICSYVATQLTKPDRHSQITSPAAFGLQFEETTVTARDGVALASWFIPNLESDRAIVLVHGKGQCRSCEFDDRFLEFAIRLHAEGFNILTIDLRAHGQSEGNNFTLGDHERWDVLGGVDWLQRRSFEKIGVLGVSLGAVSSVYAACDADSGQLIKALVLDSGVADFPELLATRFTKESGLPTAFLPGSLLMARVLLGTDVNAIKAVNELPKIKAPLMLIFGGQDAMVPHEQFSEMAAARPDAEIWFVEEATHARIYNARPEDYVARVARFFTEALR